MELHYFEGIWDPSSPPAMTDERAFAALTRLVGIERAGFRHPSPPSECHEEAAEILATLDAIDGPSVYAGFLAHRAALTESTTCCDQTPRNVYLLEQLLDIYPRGHAVVVIRDPRDVLLSQKNRWRRRTRGIETMSRRDQLRLWAGYHPITMSHLWRTAAASAQRVADHPRVHIVRFEDLIASPAPTVAAMCDTIGLPFDDALLAVARSGSSHGPAVVGGTGFDRSAVGRWRSGGLSATEVATTERITADHLVAFGYEPSEVQVSALRSALSMSALPFKGALAIVLNLSRSRRLLRAARRRLGRSNATAVNPTGLSNANIGADS